MPLVLLNFCKGYGIVSSVAQLIEMASSKGEFLWLLFHIWQKWGAPNDITLSWPFIMLGEAVFEREDDPPGSKGTM
jgi:hypothetical protein